MKTCEKVWESMKTCEKVWESISTSEKVWESVKMILKLIKMREYHKFSKNWQWNEKSRI